MARPGSLAENHQSKVDNLEDGERYLRVPPHLVLFREALAKHLTASAVLFQFPGLCYAHAGSLKSIAS